MVLITVISRALAHVGAGPVGLVSALLLANQGVKVTVLESAPALNWDLRASTFHPPTLDMLAPLGLTDELVAQGLVARYNQQRDSQAGASEQAFAKAL